MITLELSCDKNTKEHTVVFENFEYADAEPRVIIAGASSEPRYAAITGQGSRTTKFLLYHFEKRIAEFSPDIWRFDNVHMSRKGNDMLYEQIVSLNIF